MRSPRQKFGKKRKMQPRTELGATLAKIVHRGEDSKEN
jgi:hypothetical protein